MTTERPYHHGDLPAAVLVAATAEIAAVGVAELSVRRVAARAGVSHTAVAHHFGDKRGLLTALAVEGHHLLADAMRASRARGMLALGGAYLRFANEHRPLFEVMFRPDLVHTDTPALAEASQASFGQLRGSADAQATDLAYGAWALVHGIAVLWLAGNLPVTTIEEVDALFRRSARALAGRPTRAR